MVVLIFYRAAVVRNISNVMVNSLQSQGIYGFPGFFFS